jgi:AcrR family transcriptional regulator
MPRLTRAASRARTRAQLVDTARDLFLRDGYFATSLDSVAEAAGYSKGAVYSNFAGKDELCLAVLDRLLAERAAQIVGVLSGGKRFSAKLDAFEKWAESVIGDEGSSTLAIEFASQARTNPTLRAAFAQRAVAIRMAIAMMITAGAREAGVELALPAEELATTVLSVGLGLALQRAFDPSVSVRALTDTIRVVVGLPLRKPVRAARAGRVRA